MEHTKENLTKKLEKATFGKDHVFRVYPCFEFNYHLCECSFQIPKRCAKIYFEYYPKSKKGNLYLRDVRNENVCLKEGISLSDVLTMEATYVSEYQKEFEEEINRYNLR